MYDDQVNIGCHHQGMMTWDHMVIDITRSVCGIQAPVEVSVSYEDVIRGDEEFATWCDNGQLAKVSLLFCILLWFYIANDQSINYKIWKKQMTKYIIPWYSPMKYTILYLPPSTDSPNMKVCLNGCVVHCSTAAHCWQCWMTKRILNAMLASRYWCLPTTRYYT